MPLPVQRKRVKYHQEVSRSPMLVALELFSPTIWNASNPELRCNPFLINKANDNSGGAPLLGIHIQSEQSDLEAAK